MADGMTEEEIEACRLAFEKFDADGSGTIEANELKVTLQSMGQNPTDEEIFEMLSSVDEDGSGRYVARREGWEALAWLARATLLCSPLWFCACREGAREEARPAVRCAKLLSRGPVRRRPRQPTLSRRGGCCCLRSIDFGEFLMVIKEQKAATAAAGDEGDTILAFVALGGKPDKTGIISAEKLRQTCKVRGAGCCPNTYYPWRVSAHSRSR
jgi:hypothetical protein